MSTDLKSRSKAYELTRVALGGIGNGIGNVGVVVSRGYNKPAITLSAFDIQTACATGDWSALDVLDLLDETLSLLTYDLAVFALTKGDGMEAN